MRASGRSRWRPAQFGQRELLAAEEDAAQPVEGGQPLGFVAQRLAPDRRDAVDLRGPGLPQHPQQVPGPAHQALRDGHHTGAAAQRQADGEQTEIEVQGGGGGDAVLGCGDAVRQHAPVEGDHRPVTHHDAFGAPRGAGGEDDVRGVGGAGHPAPGRAPLGGAFDGQSGGAEPRGADGVGEVRAGAVRWLEVEGRPGGVDDGQQALLRNFGAHRDEGEAGAGAGEQQREGVGGGAGLQDDPGAGLDAEGVQVGGVAVHEGAEFRVGGGW